MQPLVTRSCKIQQHFLPMLLSHPGPHLKEYIVSRRLNVSLYLAKRHQPHVHCPNATYPIECSVQERNKEVPGSIWRGGDDFQTELESHPLHYKFATPVSATHIHSCLSPPTTSCVLCLALRLLPLLLLIHPFLQRYVSSHLRLSLFLSTTRVATHERVPPCCAIFPSFIHF